MKQTDNYNLKAKLDLRRHFLNRYHRDQPPHVFECCQAEGVLWRYLRQEFATASYWGVDLKPKPGRLKIDSMRVLALPGHRVDVIDIDTYGSPWAHWDALLTNVKQSVTVFLTIGVVKMGGGGGIDRVSQRRLGLADLPVPVGILGRLHELALEYNLAAAREHGFEIVEAVEAVSDGNARYLGIRLQTIPGAL